MLRAERPQPHRRYRALAIPFALAALIVAVAALFAGRASAGQAALPDGNTARTISEASAVAIP